MRIFLAGLLLFISTAASSQLMQLQRIKLSNNDSITFNVADARNVYEQPDGTAKIVYSYPSSTILTKTTFDDLVANSCNNLVVVPVQQPSGVEDVAFNPSHVHRIYRVSGRTKIQMRQTNQIFDSPLSFEEVSTILSFCGASGAIIDTIYTTSDSLCIVFVDDPTPVCVNIALDTLSATNWYSSNGSTLDSLRFAIVIKTAIWYGADTTGFLRHQVGLLDGSRITVFQDSSVIMKFGPDALNYVSVQDTSINIVTSSEDAPKRINIQTDRVNWKPSFDVALQRHKFLASGTLFDVDSAKVWAMGQFPDFPDVNFDGRDKGLFYSPDAYSEVGIYNGDGANGDYSVLDALTSSFVLAARDGNSAANAISTINFNPAIRNRIELTTSGVADPLGDNRIWQVFNDTVNYIAIGHDDDGVDQAAYFTIGIGGDNTASSFLNKNNKRAFSFQTYNAGLRAYNWIESLIPVSRADTTGDNVRLYNGSYYFDNSRPLATNGVMSFHRWTGNGVTTDPGFITMSALADSINGYSTADVNIYDNDGLLKAGGTTVGLDSGSLKIALATDAAATKYGIELIGSTATASNRWWSARTEADSARFQEFANEYYLIVSTDLIFNVSDQERHVADSVQWNEGAVQTVDSTKFILGMTSAGWMKRFDSDTSGTVLYSIGGLWKQRALSDLVAASSVNIYNTSSTIGTNRTASITDNLTFTNNSAATGERFIVTYDNGVSSTNFFQVKEGTGITMQSSQNGIWLEGATMFSDVISPTTLASNTDNYTGLNGSNFGRLSSSPSVNLTGIANGRPGRVLPLFNVGSSHITLTDNATSTALNRFQLPTNINLKTDDGALFVYDSVSERHRLLATSIGSPYTGSGQLLNGRSGSLYMSYMADTLNDVAMGYFTNGTSDDKTTFGKFGLHIDGDGGFGIGGKETYIKGANFNLLTTSYISARESNFDLSSYSRTGVGASKSISQLFGTPTVSVFRNNVVGALYYETGITFRKDWSGTPSNKRDYGALIQEGEYNGVAGDTSTLSVWWGIPQISDTVQGVGIQSDVAAMSKERGFGVQSLFDLGTFPFGILKYDWLKIKTGNVATDTSTHSSSNDGITFYGNSYEIPNQTPSSSRGDTSVMVWTDRYNSFFIDKSEFCCGGVTAADEVNVPPTIRPTKLTAKTNNWNPTNYSTTKTQTIELYGDNNFRFITGLEAATRDGVMKILDNIGDSNCVGIAKLHTDSDADNRFNIPHDIILYPNTSATFRYDSVGTSWRLISTTIQSSDYGNYFKATFTSNTGSPTQADNPTFAYTANGGTVATPDAQSGGISLRRLNLSTSTAATAFPSISCRARPIHINSNESYLRMSARILSNAAVSTNAQSYEIKFGFKNAVDTVDAEGAWINYHHSINSGQFTLNTNDGFTPASTNTTVAFAASTRYTLELIWYPHGEVAIFINGARYSTTSSMPSALISNPFFMIDKDNGTTAVAFGVTAIDFYGVVVSEETD